MTVTETRGAGLPRTERGRRTRAAIVEAAAALMYRQGVSGTSVDDVLAASGTGKSQMYHYFSDKSALTMAVVKRQSDTVMAAQPLIESVRTWADLDAWVAGVVAVHRAPGGPFACPLGQKKVGLGIMELHKILTDKSIQMAKMVLQPIQKQGVMSVLCEGFPCSLKRIVNLSVRS